MHVFYVVSLESNKPEEKLKKKKKKKKKKICPNTSYQKSN